MWDTDIFMILFIQSAYTYNSFPNAFLTNLMNMFLPSPYHPAKPLTPSHRLAYNYQQSGRFSNEKISFPGYPAVSLSSKVAKASEIEMC